MVVLPSAVYVYVLVCKVVVHATTCHRRLCFHTCFAAFPAEITIGFSQETYTVAGDEDGGIVTLKVAVLQGELGIPVYVNFSTIDGTAIGTLLCSYHPKTHFH